MLRRLLPAAILALSPAAAAAADWPSAPRDFASRADIERTALAFPNSMGLQRRRLAAAIEAKDEAGALDAARRLIRAGAGLSPAGRTQIEALVGREAMRALDARFEANMSPVGESRLLAYVPSSHRLVEGLIWDPVQRRLYATGVVERGLILVSPRAAAGLGLGAAGSLLGGAFDAKRVRLWAASAILDETPEGPGAFAGLFSFEPGTLDVTRIPAPAGATPGDVAVAEDGTVYASDGLNGAVYRCRPGCASLETFIAPGRLFSAQGMAVSSDQRRLYVADRRYGIAVVERSTGRIARLAGGPDMMLDGIDGLVARGGDLIATQTAYAPQRIIRLRLSRDGLRATRLELLERANPEWGEITLATVMDSNLVYVAGSQWERFGKGGKLKGDESLPPTPIRALRLK